MPKQPKHKDFLIPARPEVLFQIGEEIAQPRPSLDRIADLMKADVSLYANTLAMINSPFFAVRGRVTSVHTAVRVLGLKRIKFIAEMAALRSSLDGENMLTQFWDDAFNCAAICAKLAEHFNYLSMDEAYTLGMMHNCGIPLMYKECAGYKRFHEDNVLQELMEHSAQERALFGFDHFNVSSRIAKIWNVPPAICQAISYQSNYLEALSNEDIDDDVCNILSLVLIAKEMTNKFSDPHAESGEEYCPIIETDLIYEQLSMTHSDVNDMEFAILSSLNPE